MSVEALRGERQQLELENQVKAKQLECATSRQKGMLLVHPYVSIAYVLGRPLIVSSSVGVRACASLGSRNPAYHRRRPDGGEDRMAEEEAKKATEDLERMCAFPKNLYRHHMRNLTFVVLQSTVTKHRCSFRCSHSS